jgi:hypothetical protein
MRLASKECSGAGVSASYRNTAEQYRRAFDLGAGKGGVHRSVEARFDVRTILAIGRPLASSPQIVPVILPTS